MEATSNRVSVEDLGKIHEGSEIHTTLRVAEKTSAVTKGGKDYLRLVLEDKTGKAKTMLWDNVDAYDSVLTLGHVVSVYTKVGSYNGELQLTISHVEALNQTEVDMRDFRMSSQFDHKEMINSLRSLAKSCENEDVRALLDALFKESKVIEAFSISPAAQGNHHAFMSGLVEHTLSMCQLAITIADHYSAYYPNVLDHSFLIAGVVFHDLGKIWELDADGAGYTTRGKLLGHIPMSFQFIGDLAKKAKIDPEGEAVMRVQHLVLSHHGRQEWGSPVEPRTPEAFVLHYIDMIDSRMNMIGSVLKTGSGEWTDYHKALGGPIFRGLAKEEGRGSEEAV